MKKCDCEKHKHSPRRKKLPHREFWKSKVRNDQPYRRYFNLRRNSGLGFTPYFVYRFEAVDYSYKIE